jgi:hypothetical protein
MFHTIHSIKPRSNFMLLVQFTDGTAKSYDLKPLVSSHPAFGVLKDVPGLYEQVQVDAGGYGISWNDALDLDGAELWANGQPVETSF